MAETMNRKVQRAAAHVEVTAKLNDADALDPLPCGMRSVQHTALRPTFRRSPRESTKRGNRLIQLAD
jgi:hypothetical protein